MLIVYFNSAGGVSVYNQNLISYLIQEKVKFEVLEYSFLDRDKTWVRRDNNHYYAFFSRNSSRREIFDSVKEIFYRQNLIVCSDSLELEIINYYRINCKVVYILHGHVQHYSNVLMARAHIIDQVFCVSNSLMSHYKDIFKNISFKCAPPLTADYKGDIKKYKSKTLSIVYAGRLELNKGSDLLNKAAGILGERNNTEITYYLPKNGNDAEQLKNIPTQ